MFISIYVNGIVNANDKVSLVLFADDSTAYSTGKNGNVCDTNMNNILVHISNWLRSNKLTSNVGKTQALISFRRKRPIPNTQVELTGHLIAYVTKIKFIGGIVYEQFNWTEHTSFVGRK